MELFVIHTEGTSFRSHLGFHLPSVSTGDPVYHNWDTTTLGAKHLMVVVVIVYLIFQFLPYENSILFGRLTRV